MVLGCGTIILPTIGSIFTEGQKISIYLTYSWWVTQDRRAQEKWLTRLKGKGFTLAQLVSLKPLNIFT